ncbi:MAG: phosphatase [Oscillospiraceae bacterium]|jgi:exopolyphosphatase/guanosine-5'-triphosphate,3'-diphosphate pyrophosphatase|nr:phosphatase [Oscillospiraceae bacterium]
MNYAIIDLGSNTIRLCIYRYEENKIVTVIRQKEVAGLAGYVKKNMLELDGIRKACDILCEFKEIAIRFVEQNEIHVFATASLRGILNQEQVLEMIRQDTGLLPEVLSGEYEARLDYIGASHFMECGEGILIDIGGASTELVRFENARPVRFASMPVGCLSLYTGFIGKMIPTENERKNIKKEIREQLDNLGWSPEENFPLMIGVGGTVRAAHKLSRSLFSLPKGQNEMSAGFVKKILNELKNSDSEIYRTVYKLIPERTLTIVPGLMILREAIKRFNCENILVSDYGVREGYLIDRILKEGDATHACGG